MRIHIDYKPKFSERGTLEVIAEVVQIPSAPAEFSFALHNSIDVPGEYVVTHIETGYACARAESPEHAIQLATENFARTDPEFLSLMLIRAKNNTKVRFPKPPALAGDTQAKGGE